ncbi:MAG: galactose-1-phosphate uridylyltransferase [bacterium]|nr:galactose-1-phosphate uridylyltransferase [bacterium]
MSELRKDPITGRWVIISRERASRPSAFNLVLKRRRGILCPFCPGREKETPPEILACRPPEASAPDIPGWKLRVVPNRFPALGTGEENGLPEEGFFRRREGIGAHEVIIESPDHGRRFSDFSPREIEAVFRAYRDRYGELKKDRRFRYILLFKNEGAQAGATLDHPHSQLIALPVIPWMIREEVKGCREYYLRENRCIYCDLIRQEMETRDRVITESDGFVALSPYAPRFPYELWILPRKHHTVPDRSGSEWFHGLAVILRECLQRLDGVLDNPAYNLYVHSAPLDDEESASYHWHLEITPSLSRIAGFELATGFYINPVSPEEATEKLRRVDMKISKQ